MRIYNFNEYETKKKIYGGANGNKLSIIIDNELYMLKLPQHSTKNNNISYTTSAISEYIGCHIFNMFGIKAQDTLLGIYTHNGIDRIAVACKDFECDGYIFKDFASLKNQIIDTKTNGYGTDLIEMLKTIEDQTFFDSIELLEHFWDIFVVDALIGNWDRHNGNWGFLYNQNLDEIKFAPIFDCGSSLYPQIDENIIKKVMTNKSQLNTRIYDIPTSALMINGKRINYYDFISKHEYKMCDEALERLINKIDINKINELIDDIDLLSISHKEFLKLIIEKRLNLIIKS